MRNISRAQQQIVYIVTYSRADTQKFPTKKSFADAFVEAWTGSGFTIEHCVVLMMSLIETIASFPKRVDLIIKSGGYRTKY